MSAVWYCIPSARPAEEANRCLTEWRRMGYKIALWIDDPYLQKGAVFAVRFDLGRLADVTILASDYPGYSLAVNGLVAQVLKHNPDCDWIVTGGDDVFPDPNRTADEIARECSDHFYNSVELAYPPDRSAWAEIPIPSPGGSGKDSPSWKRWSTFGIMQPIADKWGRNPTHHNPEMRSAYIERVCGSPWIGRSFAERINKGQGPLWPRFTHMFGDQCLQAVATKLGVLWQREDLCHYHDHWGRKRGDIADMPDFLKSVNSSQHWRESKAEFDRLKANDFAECMPL